jgi:hypothetical protein
MVPVGLGDCTRSPVVHSRSVSCADPYFGMSTRKFDRLNRMLCVLLLSP